MTELEKLHERFSRRISEIQHYHNRFRDFNSYDERGAATYAIVMRTQIQDFLKIAEELEEYSNAQKN